MIQDKEQDVTNDITTVKYKYNTLFLIINGTFEASAKQDGLSNDVCSLSNEISGRATDWTDSLLSSSPWSIGWTDSSLCKGMSLVILR
jgi:hypothetical protein